MSVIIPEDFEDDVQCPICFKHFKVGDSVELAPVQKSKSGKEIVVKAIMVHTDCYYI